MVPRKPRSAIVAALDDVRALVAALGKSARAVEQEAGISNAQVFLLRELRASPDLTINELAARAMTKQSTVSVLVRRLESNGFVRRERADDDGRRVHVRLTPVGRTLADAAPEPATARLIEALRRMPDVELEALSTSLEKLLRALNVSPESAPPLFEPMGTPRRRAPQKRRR